MNYNLMQCRKKLKLSQKQFGEKLGMSAQSYSKREIGTRDFKQSEMIKILDIVIEYFPLMSMEELFLKE